MNAIGSGRRRPSYADVASTLALVVALGGTSAYAATTLAKNSVGTAQIQDGAVTTAKLHATAVSAGKIAGRAVKTGKLANLAVTNAELAGGAVNSVKVQNNSLSLLDLVGADVSGAITISAVPANSCGQLIFSVAGARVGQVVLMAFRGDVVVPSGLVFMPLKVDAANSIRGRVCNVSTSASSPVSDLGIRMVTFG